jgi:8-oxo-dGTP diphosphatase
MTVASRKHIHVTCAIIEQVGFILAAQRSAAMSLPLKWEFPGGKINDGESPQECLRREIAEEMGVSINVERALPPHTHNYPSFTVTLYPFICAIDSGKIILHEHAAIAWLTPEELPSLDWAEADLPVIETYLSMRAVTR